MVYEGFSTKDSLVVVFTGDGKGKTSAALGLLARALGAGWRVAYIQFIKEWSANEQAFLEKIMPIFGDNLFVYKGGRGFYKAGKLSAKNVSAKEHRQAALNTYEVTLKAATEGEYNLVICDEINNAVSDGLISQKQLAELIEDKAPTTNLCFTGRDFPVALLPLVDIATEMKKIKHHYDEKFLANFGVNY
jgi:cob(I)alamin adenosyltransferase